MSSVEITQPPKIPFFAGDSSAKTESSFDTWLYEVECFQKNTKYSTEVIATAVRHSLKGDAARVAMHIYPNACLNKLVVKLKNIYDSGDEGEVLLGDFFSAHQKDDESVSSWGCRVDQLFYKAFKTSAQQINYNHMGWITAMDKGLQWSHRG